MVAIFSYDAGTDKLTMTGTTAQFAEDAYLADQANGWGQVSKLGDRLYLFECNVFVNGQASDKNVVIQVGTEANPKWFHCDWEPDSFHLGELSGGSPINGVSFINYATPKITTRGDFKLYDSRWFHNGQPLRFQKAVDIKGCVLSVTKGLWVDIGVTGTIQDTWIHGDGNSIAWIYPQITIDNCIFENFLQGVRYAVGGTFTLRNIVLRNCGTAIYLAGSNTNLSVINCDIDWTTIFFHGTVSNCFIYRQYTFDAHCIDEDGNDLSGVLAVGEYISPYGDAFSDTSDGSGNISTQIVDHSFYTEPTGDPENLKTPLKVTYSKAGFETLVKYYDMDEKVQDCVMLCRAKSSQSKAFKVIGRQKVKTA